MTPLAESAVLCSLRDALEARGSWCGETHLQKAAYLLKVATGVPLSAHFVLYKHGPFSFDLRDSLTDMRVRGMFRLEPQPYPYGPRIAAGRRSDAMQEWFADQVEAFRPAVEAVADLVDGKGVGALESLSTALLLLRDDPAADDHSLVAQLRAVKPHIGPEEAKAAFDEIRAFLKGPVARLAS